eukprot:Em0001g1069a
MAETDEDSKGWQPSSWQAQEDQPYTDPLDSFPTTCVAPGTHRSSPSVPTCREPLIGRVVHRPYLPPALEDLGVPQQRGPELVNEEHFQCRAVATAFQVTNSDEVTARGLGSPRDWTTQWDSSCNEDTTSQHRNGTCPAISKQPGPPPPSSLSLSPPSSPHQPTLFIYRLATLGPSTTGQSDSTSCSATKPPAGVILILQKK